MATTTEQRQQNFYTECRDLAEEFQRLNSKWQELQDEWTQADYNDAAEGIVDGTNENAGLDKATLSQFVVNAGNALESTWITYRVVVIPLLR